MSDSNSDTNPDTVPSARKRASRDKPLILVVNDDGATAPGIRALAESMAELGQVVVVAPDKPQSGMGHAITINAPLFVEQLPNIGPDIPVYAVSGTPVDCVKLARDVILHEPADLVVSGVNHGSNSAINVLYSGTMSAAMEGALEGIPAIGFSLLDYSMDADFRAARQVARHLAQEALEHGLPKGTLLNVNIPKGPPEQLQGMRWCRQADAQWVEEFDARTDPRGRKYYWLTGRFVNYDQGHDADETALKEGYVSIVPVRYDFTDYSALEGLRQTWRLPNEKAEGAA
jgi:5'-nucleotidase